MKHLVDKDDNIYDQVTKYRFVGVAAHIGAHNNSGHYIAHTLRKGRYFKFDDEHFSVCKEEEALAQEAYLLFYKQMLKGEKE